MGCYNLHSNPWFSRVDDHFLMPGRQALSKEGLFKFLIISVRPEKDFFTKVYKMAHLNFDALVKSLISDGAVKSSRSRLARFRRMQRT